MTKNLLLTAVILCAPSFSGAQILRARIAFSGVSPARVVMLQRLLSEPAATGVPGIALIPGAMLRSDDLGHRVAVGAMTPALRGASFYPRLEAALKTGDAEELASLAEELVAAHGKTAGGIAFRKKLSAYSEAAAAAASAGEMDLLEEAIRTLKPFEFYGAPATRHIERLRELLGSARGQKTMTAARGTAARLGSPIEPETIAGAYHARSVYDGPHGGYRARFSLRPDHTASFEGRSRGGRLPSFQGRGFWRRADSILSLELVEIAPSQTPRSAAITIVLPEDGETSKVTAAIMEPQSLQSVPAPAVSDSDDWKIHSGEPRVWTRLGYWLSDPVYPDRFLVGAGLAVLSLIDVGVSFYLPSSILTLAGAWSSLLFTVFGAIPLVESTLPKYSRLWWILSGTAVTLLGAALGATAFFAPMAMLKAALVFTALLAVGVISASRS